LFADQHHVGGWRARPEHRLVRIPRLSPHVGYPYRVDFTTCAKLNCQRSTMWNPMPWGT